MKLEIYRSIPGLKLPDPLPPVPQIIQRLQTVIAENESRQRELTAIDRAQLTEVQRDELVYNRDHLVLLKVRLDQLLAAYPQPAASLDEKTKNTPPCDATIDHQQTSSDADATQCDAEAAQPGSEAARSASQPAQSDAPSDAQSRTGASPVPLDASSSALEPELQELALEFRHLRDQRSPLDHLTDAEHHAILELKEAYSFRAIARLLAKPRPIGLDIKTSEASLRRFVERRLKNKRRQEQRDKLALAQQIAVQNGLADGLVKASAHLLESRLLKTAADDQSDPVQLQALIKSLTALRRQTLAERKQTHREQQTHQQGTGMRPPSTK